MNWQKFVCVGNEGSGVGTPHGKSHHSLLLESVRELGETNTLANWVRTTNYKISNGRQLTLSMFA